MTRKGRFAKGFVFTGDCRKSLLPVEVRVGGRDVRGAAETSLWCLDTNVKVQE